MKKNQYFQIKKTLYNKLIAIVYYAKIILFSNRGFLYKI